MDLLEAVKDLFEFLVMSAVYAVQNNAEARKKFEEIISDLNPFDDQPPEVKK